MRYSRHSMPVVYEQAQATTTCANFSRAEYTSSPPGFPVTLGAPRPPGRHSRFPERAAAWEAIACVVSSDVEGPRGPRANVPHRPPCSPCRAFLRSLRTDSWSVPTDAAERSTTKTQRGRNRVAPRDECPTKPEGRWAFGYEVRSRRRRQPWVPISSSLTFSTVPGESPACSSRTRRGSTSFAGGSPSPGDAGGEGGGPGGSRPPGSSCGTS
jgi:hypothetical protein